MRETRASTHKHKTRTHCLASMRAPLVAGWPLHEASNVKLAARVRVLATRTPLTSHLACVCVCRHAYVSILCGGAGVCVWCVVYYLGKRRVFRRPHDDYAYDDGDGDNNTTSTLTRFTRIYEHTQPPHMPPSRVECAYCVWV